MSRVASISRAFEKDKELLASMKTGKDVFTRESWTDFYNKWNKEIDILASAPDCIDVSGVKALRRNIGEMLIALENILISRAMYLQRNIYNDYEDTSYHYTPGDEFSYAKILLDIYNDVIPTVYEKREAEKAQLQAETDKNYENGYDKSKFGEPQAGKKYYYVTCVYGGRKMLLDGPFTSHLEALQRIEPCMKELERYPEYPWIEFGTMGSDEVIPFKNRFASRPEETEEAAPGA